MKKENEKPMIPIFYAADENYLPYLIVSMYSLKCNASKEYRYTVHILTTEISQAAREKLAEYEEENFRIQCVNVSKRLEEVKGLLQLRDYYTGATYYRIFIASMFPQYDKALYLDSDTVVLGDISELYNVELGENLVGAIPDGAVAAVPAFGIYTKEVLGIEAKHYFNAGVLSMNLAQFRKDCFYDRFCALLKSYKFSVAQDQDYLNVLCSGKVRFIGEEWNRMPIGRVDEKPPKLIHYNLTMKPWHYEDVLYREFFWEYAKQTKDHEKILQALAEYSPAEKARDKESEGLLIALCLREAASEDNYRKLYGDENDDVKRRAFEKKSS